MPIKKSLFSIKGMTRDLAVSKFSPEYAYENQNIRITATDSNTTLGLVNEKGNAVAPVILDDISNGVISGTPIGQGVLNDTLVLFTTGNQGDKIVTISARVGDMYTIYDNDWGTATIEYTSNFGDHIYKFWEYSGGTLAGKTLFSGDLGFDAGSPIECICIYEDENLQKVYWTDGLNQPRVINIEASDEVRSGWSNKSFDFVKRVGLNATINITRNEVSFGSFAPGTIQYCFSYFDLYNSQTNIFYTSPLYYTSYVDRGASPSDTVSNSFTISIPANQYDNTFDYLRIYSILRTSVDATPQVRKVVDIEVKNRTDAITYIDTGVEGESIDPTELYYIGGELVTVGTMDHKDNTLFMGDISVTRESIDKGTKDACQDLTVSTTTKTLTIPFDSGAGYYAYESQLSNNNSQITYFKKGETYRLGLQAQHYTGKWSEAVYITDYKVPVGISTSSNSGNVSLINLTSTLNNSTIIESLVSKGYVKIRPIVVLPDINNRNIICQGVLCPTVYNAEDRFTNSPFAQASWFFRPNAPYSTITDNMSEIQIMANGNYPPEYRAATSYTPMSVATKGMWAEFRNNYPIPGNMENNAEIQCISYPPQPFLGITYTTTAHNGDMDITGTSVTEPSDADKWVDSNKECFYIDQSVVTLNSPDIEFNNALRTIKTGGLKLRIVGYVPFDACYSDIDIEANGPNNYTERYSDGKYTYSSLIPPGFINIKVSATCSETGFGWKSLLAGALWFDSLAGHQSIAREAYFPSGFIVYPWHRNGALNNARTADETGYMASKLLHKKMSITRFSANTLMLSTPWEAYIQGNTTNTGISDAIIFDSDQVSMVKVKAPVNSGLDDIVYYGNIDKILTFHNFTKNPIADWDTDINSIEYQSGNYLSTIPAAYPIAVGSPELTNEEKIVVNALSSSLSSYNYPSIPVVSGGSWDWWASITEGINVKTEKSVNTTFGSPHKRLACKDSSTLSHYIYETCPTCSTDPVSIKYKSSPHLVMALNYTTEHLQRVLPTHNGINSATTSWTNDVFWKGSTVITGVSQDSISISDTIGTGYLWLGELYRDDIDDNTRFGGKTEEAIANNSWTPAGPAVSIVDSNGDALSSVTLLWNEGDTYYQRYDCLKTYPFTLDDQNSVTDILSFMCETRVNIDGRYDRNRGKLSNLYTTPVNFNLLNTAYSQTDNFFTYRSNNSNRLISNVFPNAITWTKTKTAGETVDTWTNVTLASMLEVDGDKGTVRAIRRFNNDLLSFQDKGISQILYNESVQIASTTGVPIEIANSGKVSGKRYISNHVGCANKWSICSTPTGIYFIDDIGKDIYLFNGQLNNLSDTLGFHSWIVNALPGVKIWNPRDFSGEGEITYYDKVNGDVMFITGDTCLTFSEPLNGFSSFYSYGNTPYFANIKSRGVAWHVDDNVPGSSQFYPWWHREGNYNYYYNVYHPFSVTVVANETPISDKIFNNLEYRGDTFNPTTGDYIHDNTFDYLETWNEYQKGTSQLVNTPDIPSTLKKKFRIWRANIPRNNTNQGGDTLHNYTRDRMRNPWLYIKLAKNTENTYKTILHDLVVYYFE